MFGWLKEKAWQVGFAASVVVAVGLAFNLWIMKNDRDKYFNQIYGRTGYVAQLTTCHNNISSLESGIKSQNDAIERVRADGQSRIDKASQEVSYALERAKRSDAKLDKLRQAPQGSTTCEKYQDVDARYQEFLK